MLGLGNPQQLPSVTKNLLVINVLIFVVMLLSPLMDQKLTTYAALHYFTSPGFKLWQLVTYMFVHGGFGHLLFNMIALYFFGPPIERVLGKERFLFFYLTCGIGAALVQEGVFAIMIHHYASVFQNAGSLTSLLRHLSVTNQELFNIGINPAEPVVHQIFALYHTPTIGASGAIFGILLAFGYMFPNIRLYLIFPPIPIKARVFVLIYAGIELLMGIYNSQADTVAHFAHLGGMLFGLLILIYWRRKHIIGGPYF